MLTREDSFDDLLHSYLEELQLHQFSRSSVRHASRVLGLLFDHLVVTPFSDSSYSSMREQSVMPPFDDLD